MFLLDQCHTTFLISSFLIFHKITKIQVLVQMVTLVKTNDLKVKFHKNSQNNIWLLEASPPIQLTAPLWKAWISNCHFIQFGNIRLKNNFIAPISYNIPNDFISDLPFGVCVCMI